MDARGGAEAEKMARLQHANIVQIREIGEHQGLPDKEALVKS